MESVLSQTSKEFEWIIIDGSSNDGSVNLLERHSDSITFWSSEPDTGIYNAMNRGIARSKGDYCLFLNSGDILFSDGVISKVLPLLDGTDFLVGDIYLSSDHKMNMVKDEFFTEEGVVWVMNQFGFPHQSTFIRRSVLLEWGGYREDMKISSDWWLCFQALMIGNATIKHIPCDISIYDVNGISSSNKKLLLEERESLLKERKYWYAMHSFYNDNYDIVKAIRCNRFVFFLVRLYFFFYRLFK